MFKEFHRFLKEYHHLSSALKDTKQTIEEEIQEQMVKRVNLGQRSNWNMRRVCLQEICLIINDIPY